MLDPRDLNARGVRARQAFDILLTLVTAPQPALVAAYARATFSNLMKALEDDYGVAPGYFGSQGALLQEINPFDGNPMPPPVSREPPPQFTPPSTAPLNPPTPTNPPTPPPGA